VALPTFFVVGAARCGTTSLHNFLDQHPQIAMSRIKEPNFFTFRQDGRTAVPLIDERRIVVKSVSDPDDYERLFTVTPQTQAVGDVSPLYLYVEQSAALIAAACPESRIIVLVRDPAARAYSHFLLTYSGERAATTEAFAAAVDSEWELGYAPYRSGTHALRLGRYHEQLARYDALFGRDRILLLRSSDLADDPATTLAAVCRFVGVDDAFRFDTVESYNAAGIPRPGLAGRLEGGLRRVQPYVKRAMPRGVVGPLAGARERMRRALVTAAPPLEASMRRRLIDGYYAADLAALRSAWGVELIGGDHAPARDL
jgi:hypothetical protein